MLHTKKPNEKQIELIFTNVKNIHTKKTNKKYMKINYRNKLQATLNAMFLCRCPSHNTFNINTDFVASQNFESITLLWLSY